MSTFPPFIDYRPLELNFSQKIYRERAVENHSVYALNVDELTVHFVRVCAPDKDELTQQIAYALKRDGVTKLIVYALRERTVAIYRKEWFVVFMIRGLLESIF